MKTSEMLKAALQYSSWGWHVFPLFSINSEVNCSCGNSKCKSIGKHPRNRGGYLEATTDRKIIEDWWTQWPNANIGISTGLSQLVVIDVDPRHGGDDSWNDIVRELGEDIQETVISLTGGGGEHYFYRLPKGNAISSSTGRLADGIDVRSKGGYVVAPPSRHSSGNRYIWEARHHPEDMEMKILPSSLECRLSQPETKTKSVILRPEMPQFDRPDKANRTFAFEIEGAPIGQQRIKALEMARRCLNLGYSPEKTTAKIWAGLLKSDWDVNREPWTEEDASTMVKYLISHDRYASKDTELSNSNEDKGETKELEMLIRPQEQKSSGIISAADLMSREFPEQKWIIPDLLPTGLTFFAGKPKIGKSWMALNLAVAVATGGYALGKIQVERGEVLYLALEDNPRRLQNRLSCLLKSSEAPSNLHFATNWPRVGGSGDESIKNWLQTHKETRLIIIDTFAMIRRSAKGGGYSYNEDYAAAAEIKKFADEYDIGVLVIHHLRKMSSDDPMEMITGTTGLTGAADSYIVIKRERGRADAVLHINGRDLEDQELALQWDAQLLTWSLMGDAKEIRRSKERSEIIQIIEAAKKPLSPTETSKLLGKSTNTVKHLMWTMSNDSELNNEGGKYSIMKDNFNTSDNPIVPVEEIIKDHLDNGQYGEDNDDHENDEDSNEDDWDYVWDCPIKR